MDLGYERVDHLVAISAAEKNTRLCTEYSITENGLVIRYSNYVKSQVHLNVSSDLYDRPLSEYVNALRYLSGNRKYYSYAIKTLRYFYLDMAKFLVNNENDIQLRILIDVDLGIPESVYDFDEVKSKISSMVECVTNGGEGLEDIFAQMESFEYADIFNECDSAADIEKKINSYTTAAVLMKEGKADSLQKVVIAGGNYDSKVE